MNQHDWQVCHALALVVLDRFAESVEKDGGPFDFKQEATAELEKFQTKICYCHRSQIDPDLLASWLRGAHGVTYEPAHIMHCIIEELIERAALALGGV